MFTEEIIVKKVIPEEGFLLTDGEVVTDAIFVGVSESISNWWEIPDENYMSEVESGSID